jgi:flagellar L-ring protein precursor FlgH
MTLTRPTDPARRHHTTALCAATSMLLLLLSACASAPPSSSAPQVPFAVTAMAPSPLIERVNTGAIFQPGMTANSLFSGDRGPRRVGDTLKIEIAETLSASNKVKTDTTRNSSLSQKGPGSNAGSGFLASVLNLEATASGSNAFKGSGQSENQSQFTGQLAVTVINVLPNGHLVVAGDRSIAHGGSSNLLRFSGIVNPKDIRAGNIVASADTVNARMELLGQGEVSEATSRSWVQKVLADSLAYW